MPDAVIPIVALVGRPNVGKSTLFNRITRTKDALVDDFPGVTRDRHYGQAVWNDVRFDVVDTGGFIIDDVEDFAQQVRLQVKQAIEDADVVILVLDGKSGPSPFDADLVKMLRNLTVPVFYGVNKIDGPREETRHFEFFDLGIDHLYSFSAEHGYGVPDFLDRLVEKLPRTASEPDVENLVRLAVVGRPNAGKSSLINKILGQDRLLVSDVPGTTRDSVDTIYQKGDKQYCFIDTAGIRRKSKVSAKIEKFSIIKALKSLERCDVALIILDAQAGITEQDIRVAGYAFQRGCGCIFLLNKWDLVEKDHKTAKRYMEDLRHAAKFLNFAPVLTVSALTGLRMPKIFNAVDEVYRQYTIRIGTGPLNRIINQASERTEPSLHKGKRLKFYYTAQVKSKPPSFVCFVNAPKGVHFSYQRYLMNQIRDEAGLDKTPIRLTFKERSGRIDFSGKKKKRLPGKRVKKGQRKKSR